MLKYPGMDVGAIHAARRAHIGDDAEKFPGFQLAEAIHTVLGTHHLITTTLERGPHIRHNGGFIFNE
jgi:hypothetical protein